MALDRDTALAIINEAKSEGYEEEPLPETDESIIERGTYWYEEAKKVFEQGVRNNAVQSIIWLGDSAMLEDKQRRQEVSETYPRRSSGGLSEGDEREGDAATIAQRENLPIPAHIEGDAEAMPRDISVIGDGEVRRLSGIYNAYLARATYLLSVESASLVQAEHILEGAKAAAMKQLPKADKKMTVKEKEAEIADDPEVKKWADKVAEHEAKVAVLKGLKEIYSGNVSVLSREWTMRQNEWEKGR